MDLWDEIAWYYHHPELLREVLVPQTDHSWQRKVELAAHQTKALAKLDNGKILCGLPGSGKSRVAVAYYLENEAPKDVYVITTAKKRDSLDWEGEFAPVGVGRTDDGTLEGVLTVDSWNNIEKYLGIQDAFFIFDEQRVVGTGAWAKTFVKLARKNNWILLSGTPGDTWLDYIPVFVANGFYKNPTEFKREHVVYTYYRKFPKVERYLGVGTLVRHRNNVLVQMPFRRHTYRHEKTVLVDFDRTLFDKVVKDRWHVYEERPLRDVSEMFSVMRKVVNSDSSRLQAVETLLETHPRLIVWYNFNYELDILRLLGDRVIPLQLAPPTPRSTTRASRKTKTRELSTSLSGSERNSGSDSTRRSPKTLPDRLFMDPETSTSFGMGETGLFVPSQSTSQPSSGDSGLTIPTTRSDSTSTERSRSSKSSTSIGTSTPIDKSFLASDRAAYSVPTLAEWNGHKHQPVPTTDSWAYLVQYVAGSEGWNCVSTDTMCFYSLTYSYKNFEQAKGRIDRLNTPFTDLHYYILRSNSMIDKAIWKSLSEKHSFQESDLVV